MFIASDKALFFNLKLLILFLFLHKNLCCGTNQKHLAEDMDNTPYLDGWMDVLFIDAQP